MVYKLELLKTIKRILTDSSRLAQYLSILQEPVNIKVRRLLADQTDVSNKQQQQSKYMHMLQKIPIIDPISSSALIWGSLVFLSVMYYYIEMGLVLTYGQVVWLAERTNPVTLLIDTVTILILWMQIPFRMSCGFIFKGMVITNRNRILNRYLRGQFLLDLITAIMLIVVITIPNYLYNFAKIFLVFKLLRLSQIDDCFMRRLNLNKIGKTLYVIFKLMVILFLVSHIIGLIFFAMDNYFLTSGYYQSQYTWLTTSTAYSPISQLDWPLQYLYSLYWGVNQVTNISYGDIAPSNPIEICYVIPMMCMGFVLYGYASTNIIRIIIWARSHRTIQRQQTIQMENYMQKIKTSQDVRKRVRQCLDSVYIDEGKRDIDVEQKMKKKLPLQLARSLVQSLYCSFDYHLQFIFKEDQANKLLLSLIQKRYSENETVFKQGQHAFFIYFLHKGHIYHQINLKKTGLLISESLSNHHIFGQLQFFTKKQHPFQCIASEISIIYQISYDSLNKEFVNSPNLKEQFQFIRVEIIENKQYYRIMYKCYFCQQNHDFRQCQLRLPQFRNIKFLMQEHHNNKRYDRIKINALKHKKNLHQISQISKIQRRIMRKIQKRIIKIKNKLRNKDRDFQVDSVHDWKIFKPQYNFNNVKQRCLPKNFSRNSILNLQS